MKPHVIGPLDVAKEIQAIRPKGSSGVSDVTAKIQKVIEDKGGPANADNDEKITAEMATELNRQFGCKNIKAGMALYAVRFAIFASRQETGSGLM